MNRLRLSHPVAFCSNHGGFWGSSATARCHPVGCCRILSLPKCCQIRVSGGTAVGDVLADARVESICDVLEAVEADAGIAGGLPALDLLLGDAEAVGQGSLSEVGCDAGLDQC